MGLFVGYPTPENAPIPMARPIDPYMWPQNPGAVAPVDMTTVGSTIDRGIGGLGGMGGMPAPQPAQTPFLQSDNFGNILQAMGMSLMGSPRNAPLSGFGQALQVAQQGSASRQQQAEQKATINKTKQWLLSQGLSAEEADAAASNPTVLSALIKRMKGGEGSEYGLNPQYGVDAEGNPVLIQIGKDGTSIRTPLPEGVTLSKEPIKLDAKTHWVLLDPITRQQVGIIPKETYEEAVQSATGTAAGKALGEDTATYESMSSKMPGLETVVAKLDDLSNKATYTLAGQAVDWTRAQSGGVPREAAVARAEYTAIVDNQILPLLRDTFGAQFTAKEGETLRATLGDPNKSPPEKQAVLRSFIEQKRRDIEALGVRTGKQPAPTQNRLRFNPATGDFE